MSDFVMMDYINETQEAALHIVDKSEDLCRVFAENFAKKPYERVILAASGTSYNACVTARYFMEKMLGVPCVTVTSYAFAHFEDTLKPDQSPASVCLQNAQMRRKSLSRRELPASSP